VAGQDDAPEVGGVDALHRHRRSGPRAARNDGGRLGSDAGRARPSGRGVRPF
jgi:hypothetical protein